MPPAKPPGYDEAFQKYLKSPDYLVQDYQYLVKNRAELLFQNYSTDGLRYEDVEAECWLVFMKCVKNWRGGEARLTTYFYAAIQNETTRIIARALALGTHFRRSRHMALLRDASLNQPRVRDLLNQVYDRPDPSEILARKDDEEMMERMLSALTPDERFLILEWAKGTPRAEMLKELQCGATSMNNHRHRILAKMAANARPKLPVTDA